ncbi:MAG: hypothetical protein Q9187_007841 [Circinaria calcarea]
MAVMMACRSVAKSATVPVNVRATPAASKLGIPAVKKSGAPVVSEKDTLWVTVIATQTNGTTNPTTTNAASAKHSIINRGPVKSTTFTTRTPVTIKQDPDGGDANPLALLLELQSLQIGTLTPAAWGNLQQLVQFEATVPMQRRFWRDRSRMFIIVELSAAIMGPIIPQLLTQVYDTMEDYIHHSGNGPLIYAPRDFFEFPSSDGLRIRVRNSPGQQLTLKIMQTFALTLFDYLSNKHWGEVAFEIYDEGRKMGEGVLGR